MPPREISWEENTEHRVGVLEAKMDKLLDPESGIYPKMGSIEVKITRAAIGVSGLLLANLITLLVHH